MKPKDITIDMVRDALRRHGEWCEQNPTVRGRYTDADNLAWYVHGYEPSDDYRTRAERKQAVLATGAFGTPSKQAGLLVGGPMPSQVQAVRRLLKLLVDAGEAELRDRGNSHSFAFLTTRYREQLQRGRELQAKAEAAAEQLKQVLTPDAVRTEARELTGGEPYVAVNLRLDANTAALIARLLRASIEA